MSRGNRHKRNSRSEQRPIARFKLTGKVAAVDATATIETVTVPSIEVVTAPSIEVVAAPSIAEAFSDLELEFFRQGDELIHDHHDDLPEPEIDTAWPTPAPEPAI
jgi:hypothetical protein